MPLTFAHSLDRPVVLAAVDLLPELVESPLLAERWDAPSALPGMSVGGVARHLVSQPECAVEFLTAAVPPAAPVLGLVEHYDRADWLTAPLDAPENTSIRDDFNDLASAGPADTRAVLAHAREQLPAALAAAGARTYSPWQDCSLATEDFLVVRLMEIVVHADDLAVSLGVPTPQFAPDVLEPVLALLAALALRRRGQDPVLRALSRHERAGGSVSAF